MSDVTQRIEAATTQAEASAGQAQVWTEGDETASYAQTSGNEVVSIARKNYESWAQFLGISVLSNSDDYRVALKASLPSAVNSSGSAYLASVFGETGEDAIYNGRYYQLDGTSAWVQIMDGISNRVSGFHYTSQVIAHIADVGDTRYPDGHRFESSFLDSAKTKGSGLSFTYYQDRTGYPEDGVSGVNGVTIYTGANSVLVGDVSGNYDPRPYGGLGNEIADDTLALYNVAIAANGRDVYLASGFTFMFTSLSYAVSLSLKGKGTLKRIASQTGDAISINGTDVEFKAKGPSFDGNKDNQTDRHSFFVVGNGEKPKVFDISYCNFTNTVTAGVSVKKLNGYFSAVGCEFEDMAEHTGNTGDETMGIRFVSGGTTDAIPINVLFNRFHADIPSVVGRAAGGVLISIGTASAYSPVGMINAKGNYFNGIGQDAGGNFIGGVDLYSNCHNSNVESNKFENSRINSIKCGNSQGLKIVNNSVISVDPAADSGGIFVAQARTFDVPLDDFIISGNSIDLRNIETGGAYEASGILVFGNTADPTKWVQNVTISDNYIRGVRRGVWISGATNVKISGGTIRDVEEDSIYIQDGHNIYDGSVLISVENVTFQDTNLDGGVWYAVRVDADDNQNIRATCRDNHFYNAQGRYFFARNIDMVQFLGNESPDDARSPGSYSIDARARSVNIGNNVMAKATPYFTTGLTFSSSTVSALASDNSFNDSAGLFIQNGLKEGDELTISGGTNTGVVTITSITTSKIIVSGITLVDESAGFSITMLVTVDRLIDINSFTRFRGTITNTLGTPTEGGFNVTVTGASIGDIVTVYPNASLSSTTWSALVTATDTVKISYVNPTGFSIGERTWTVIVDKQ